MAYEQKPNSGILAKNTRPPREGKQDAEYTGSALIGGVEYYIDAWVNEFKSGPSQGKKYFKLQFKPKGQRSGGSSNQSSQSHRRDDDDHGTPF